MIDTDEPRLHGKALTGNLKGMWRYRIMDYRLIVEIQDDVFIIVAVDFDHRKKIYENNNYNLKELQSLNFKDYYIIK